jgi:rSAM/selenodomain-associated transferase 2
MSDISVVIPTLNAAGTLAATVAALGPAVEVIVADGGSNDETLDVAARLGARIVGGARGRGPQLIAGAAVAKGPWLLFLHADTVLAPGWRVEASEFMVGAGAVRAAVFCFHLDEDAGWARWLEWAVAWRTRLLCLPYGDQGLLIHKDLYRQVGGFRPIPLMEDVDIVRRIGCARLRRLRTPALTSAGRWRRDGWMRRSARNLSCLTLYFVGVPPRILARLYG